MILITGGAGYIGAVTAELIEAQGRSVVTLDNLSRGHTAAVAQNGPFYIGDIGDRELVSRIAREHKLDSCIHFAALAYVNESVVRPDRYFENNVQQGISFLNALLEAGVRRVVFSSTCAVYGEPQQTPISEEHPRQPTNPYGWSKLFIERILESYDRAYGLKFVALRYFNAAGATKRHGEHHEPETHLVPNILAAALGSAPAVPVFGNDYATPDGTPIRDYVHVSDLAAAHIRALDFLEGGGGSEFINLGSGRGYSVLEVIDAARRLTQQPIMARIESRRPGDPSHLVANIEKAQRLLGWRPAHSDLDAIIRSAWEWRLAHPRGYVK